MVRRLVDLVGVFIATTVIQWLVRKLPRSLLDNAITGYLDNKIGGFFGLTEAAVDGFLLEWAFPLVVAIAAVLLWHLVAVRTLKNGATKQSPAARARLTYGWLLIGELSPKVGDGGNREGGISWGCLTPPLLHRRSDMPCPKITSSS